MSDYFENVLISEDDELDDASVQGGFDDLAKEVQKPVPVPKSPSSNEKRKAHEEQEAKRKAEWEAAQQAKRDKEQSQWEHALSCGEDEVLSASAKRISTETERLTRRNMKVCVADHIQAKCAANPKFARQVLHPRKNMVNCFRYINRLAFDFIKKEMEDNGDKVSPGGFGGDVPDDLCYQWAEEYFFDMDAEEDNGNDEKFVSKPYYGSGSAPSKIIGKPPEKKEETPKRVNNLASDGQLSFGEVLSVDCI